MSYCRLCILLEKMTFYSFTFNFQSFHPGHGHDWSAFCQGARHTWPRGQIWDTYWHVFFWEMGGTPRGNPFILHREQIDLNSSFISLSLSVSLTIFYWIKMVEYTLSPFLSVSYCKIGYSFLHSFVLMHYSHWVGYPYCQGALKLINHLIHSNFVLHPTFAISHCSASLYLLVI